MLKQALTMHFHKSNTNCTRSEIIILFQPILFLDQYINLRVTTDSTRYYRRKNLSFSTNIWYNYNNNTRFVSVSQNLFVSWAIVHAFYSLNETTCGFDLFLFCIFFYYCLKTNALSMPTHRDYIHAGGAREITEICN